MNLKKKISKNKGITLIALVVTIIVLLILAGISIQMLTGQNGILLQGSKAKKESTIGSEKEEISLVYSTLKAEKIKDGSDDLITSEEFDEELKNNNINAKTSGKNFLTIKFNDSNNVYIINQEGKITKDETKKVEDTTPGEISGDGTDANPYKIQSIEDLVYFENQVNNGNNYTGKTIRLEVSLNFASDNSYALKSSLEKGGLKEQLTSGEGFESIGSYCYKIYTPSTGKIIELGSPNKFEGTFDGNNNSLSNLYINKKSTVRRTELEDGNVKLEYFNTRVSLFGENDGKICNLNIENADLCGNYWIAGIAVRNDNEIDNCHILGDIINSNATGYIGGITQENAGTIINSSNNSSIKTKTVTAAGGITYWSKGTIKNCYNKAEIEVNNGMYGAGICRRGC